jgi:hypothetical protein
MEELKVRLSDWKCSRKGESEQNSVRASKKFVRNCPTEKKLLKARKINAVLQNFNTIRERAIERASQSSRNFLPSAERKKSTEKKNRQKKIEFQVGLTSLKL